jgi:hypothetical protein
VRYLIMERMQRWMELEPSKLSPIACPSTGIIELAQCASGARFSAGRGPCMHAHKLDACDYQSLYVPKCTSDVDHSNWLVKGCCGFCGFAPFRNWSCGDIEGMRVEKWHDLHIM